MRILIKNFITKIFLLSLMATITTAYAAEPKWQAGWIWGADALIPNSWMAFRQQVSLDADDLKNNIINSNPILAYISADTKYWLWINGEMVVFEGSYTGGPSPVKAGPRFDNVPVATNRYYDTVDISAYLKKGENTIAALVWYYGDNGQKGTNISSGEGGFFFQAQAGNTLIATDETWKVQKHTGYIQHLEKKKPFRVAAWNIQYDARSDLQDWSEQAWYLANFDDTTWQNPKRALSIPRAPFYHLFPSEIPILKDHGLASCSNFTAASFPFVSTGKKIQCKLDFNKNFTPYFDIEAAEGIDIHIKSNMRLNTIETFYTTKAGRQQFESYSWSNGHTIEYDIPAGVTVHGLKYRWTGIGETPGTFEASDAWYQRIWQMAENTLYICARDNFMDTPDRERGLWIGDVADQASYLFYSMDQPGRDLMKKAIRVTLAFSDSETGIFAGLGPGRFRELPAQSLQFIEQGIWHYYFNTGDKETLAFAYPYVQRYLALWQVQENGLIAFRNGDWKWTDWGPQETVDYDPIQNALYYSALISARKMAKVLGDNTDMSFYNSRILALKQAYQTNYWQDGFYSSDANKFKDDRTNALAILVGLAEPKQFEQIVDNVLLKNHFASPHFEWMVYNAMALAGRYDDALARMKTRYQQQVDDPKRTTLAEYLPIGGTDNHAWNAPSTVLSRYIAGIEPTSVAWQTYQILPNMAHMTRVKQVVPSVQGTISSEIARTGSAINLTITSPTNTLGVIGIPKQYFDIDSITINKKRVFAGGKYTNKQNSPLKGVTWLGEDEKYIKFELAAGNWQIVASK